jgi:hypothetical protein
MNQLAEEIVGQEISRTGQGSGHTRRVGLKNDSELANTREKLGRLEVLYQAAQNETGGDEELRDAEMESLMRLINQLKEEIARYEARQLARR